MGIMWHMLLLVALRLLHISEEAAAEMDFTCHFCTLKNTSNNTLSTHTVPIETSCTCGEGQACPNCPEANETQTSQICKPATIDTMLNDLMLKITDVEKLAKQ